MILKVYESFRAHVLVWNIPCIARVMVWIFYPGGGSKVPQQAEWNPEWLRHWW